MKSNNLSINKNRIFLFIVFLLTSCQQNPILDNNNSKSHSLISNPTNMMELDNIQEPENLKVEDTQSEDTKTTEFPKLISLDLLKKIIHKTDHSYLNFPNKIKTEDPEKADSSHYLEHSFPLLEAYDESLLQTAGNSTTSSSQDKSPFVSIQNMRRIYESLLSKEVINNGKLSKKIGSIYKRIFQDISHNSKKNFEIEAEVETFRSKKTEDPLYPQVLGISQKQKTKDYEKAVISDPNPLIVVDYLLWTSKEAMNRKQKGKSILSLGSNLENIRQHLFDVEINNPERSPRGQRKDNLQDPNLRDQIGVATIDLDILKLPDAKAWPHWARDRCIITNAGEKDYTKNAGKIGLPIACGVSGSTLLAIWPIIASGVTLDVQDLRYIILSIWAALCSDGGHVLQEVLTTVKMLNDYLNKLHVTKPESIAEIDKITMKSLKTISDTISINGSDDNFRFFGSSYESFFQFIDSEDFKKSRQNALREFIDLLNKNKLPTLQNEDQSN